MKSLNLKKLLYVFTLELFLCSNVFAAQKYTEAFFSPNNGPRTFEKIYKDISQAKKFVHLSIYSWSDRKVVDSLIQAVQNGAQVRLVLHPDLYKNKSTIKKWVYELETLGAEVKLAKQKMHEKIFLIDGKLLINSSANLSSGPKSKYSENWIFHYYSSELENIFQAFTHEFTVLWNTGTDVITSSEKIADALDEGNFGSELKLANNPEDSNAALLYSSSMNFKLEKNSENSQDFKEGKYFSLYRKKDSKRRSTWLVRDKILETINGAKSNISCSFNHLFIEEISDALVDAVKRGVNVRLTVDNQEFKLGTGAKEMTPKFVEDWKKLQGHKNLEVPVRVKFYSIEPSPSYWFLNHHKFCVIDYGTDTSSLISGSYNFSKTAEHSQFDNQVFYSGELFKNLYSSFQEEFEYLWTLNRDKSDSPNEGTLNYFLEPSFRDAYPLHSNEPVSLTWSEATELLNKLEELAPGITRTNIRNRNCRSYKYDFNTKKGRYFGCPGR